MSGFMDAYVRGLQTDHHEMELLVRGLREALTLGDAEGWSVAATATVSRRLARLEAHMERHFASEEEGGYMEEALARAPRLGQQAAKLLAQHAEFKRTLFRLQTAVDRSREAPRLWPRLARDIDQLLKKIEAHEAAENRLIENGLNVDLEIPV